MGTIASCRGHCRYWDTTANLRQCLINILKGNSLWAHKRPQQAILEVKKTALLDIFLLVTSMQKKEDWSKLSIDSFERYSSTRLIKKLWMKYFQAVSSYGSNLQWLWVQSLHAHSHHLSLRNQWPALCAHVWTKLPMNGAILLIRKVSHNYVKCTFWLYLRPHPAQLPSPIANSIAGTSKSIWQKRQNIMEKQRVRTPPQALFGTLTLWRLKTTHPF